MTRITMRSDPDIVKQFKKQSVEEDLTYSKMFEKMVMFYLAHENHKPLSKHQPDYVKIVPPPVLHPQFSTPSSPPPQQPHTTASLITPHLHHPSPHPQFATPLPHLFIPLSPFSE